MSIASQFPRLDALGLTIHNYNGLSFVDATELRAALQRSAIMYPINSIIPVGGTTISTGYSPVQIEINLNRLAGSNASFGPTIGPVSSSCPQ